MSDSTFPLPRPLVTCACFSEGERVLGGSFIKHVHQLTGRIASAMQEELQRDSEDWCPTGSIILGVRALGAFMAAWVRASEEDPIGSVKSELTDAMRAELTEVLWYTFDDALAIMSNS